MSQSIDASTFTLEVGDGRQVAVLTAGPRNALPLVFHTGTPGGLVPYQPMLAAAASRGLRTVMYSRPGYGRSTPMPGRRVANAAADVAFILDHLGAEEFVTAGWSGGGPHALASAAVLADRCKAVASIAGVAPRDATGLDWLAGMAAENLSEFGAAERGEAALTTELQGAAEHLASVTSDQIITALGGLVPSADRAALEGGFADWMARSFRDSLSSGIAGWRDDDLAFVAHWGFDPSPLGERVPLSIWQGDQDAMVPFTHGQWLAREYPAARANLLPGEGHITVLVNRLGAVLDELLQLARA